MSSNNPVSFGGGVEVETQVEETSLIDQLLAAVGDRVGEVVRPPATPEQRQQVMALRQVAVQLGGEAAEVAKQKCLPYAKEAEEYLEKLRQAITNRKLQLSFLGKSETQVQQPVSVQSQPTVGNSYRYQARSGVPATRKQWGMVWHLRRRLKEIGEGWAVALATRSVGSDRRVVSDYIDEMIQALKRRYDATPQTTTGGGLICSACWKPGCTIGPMVRR